MSKLKIAIQKKGRLSEKSIQLLRDAGIQFSQSSRKLKAESSNFPLEILFLRDDDIPHYVSQGVADIGIVGQNEVWEQDKEVEPIRELGFAKCKMALAIPKDVKYPGLSFFDGKTVATSYPTILKSFFEEKNLKVNIEEIGGSVEIATGIGLAAGIFDIISTGSTLLMNGLKPVEEVKSSEAVLIASPTRSQNIQALIEALQFRINAVQQAQQNKYILLNAPENRLAEIQELLPGMKSPTILPLVKEGWCSLHSVVNENDFWNVIDQLKNLGAEGILVVPIEKMVV